MMCQENIHITPQLSFFWQTLCTTESTSRTGNLTFDPIENSRVYSKSQKMSQITWLIEAAREIEKILRVMGGHYIEWSQLETECSVLSCLARVDSTEEFQSRIAALFRIMDHHIDSIQYYLTYYLINTIRAIEIRFPMTPAGKAAVQGRKYPTLEATCLNYWNSKESIARGITNRAKDILPEIPADRARVERLDKTLPGYRRQYEEVVMLCNAPVDKREDAEFKQEFKELMEEVKTLMQDRAPRASRA